MKGKKMTSSLKGYTTRPATRTAQTKKAAKGQVKNAAGGYVFKISDLERAKRFLILGSESNFYVPGAALTAENAETLVKLAESKKGSRALVDEIVAVSTAGRAPKQDPAIFALAIAVSHGDTESKQYALSQLPVVLRTGTSLFMFAGFVEQFRGWGRGLKNAIARWYTEKDVDKLAYQAVKYQSREGYTHRDLMRLSHPETASSSLHGLGEWILRGNSAEAPRIVQGFVQAHTPGTDIPALVQEYHLTWEMLPTESLNEREVWEALLDGNVPLGALVRQLPRLTRIGVIEPMGYLTTEIAARLVNPEELKRARLHPINLLVALKTYASGRSVRGSSTWTPVREIIDALDTAFYVAFGAVEAANKRTMIGVDVSGSMGSTFSDLPLTSAEAAAAMALVTMATEPKTVVYGFSHVIKELPISPKQRLNDVLRVTRDNNFGGTNAALLIQKAIEQNLSVDTFMVITDNDTWAGSQHVFQALTEYRKKTGIAARLVVLSTYASRSSVADPSDPLSLDIAGFDLSTPSVVADFSAGRI